MHVHSSNQRSQRNSQSQQSCGVLTQTVIKSKEMLAKEVDVWTTRRNEQRKMIAWTFTKERADKKLGKYYVS